jgi:hypothetical protein
MILLLPTTIKKHKKKRTLKQKEAPKRMVNWLEKSPKPFSIK